MMACPKCGGLEINVVLFGMVEILYDFEDATTKDPTGIACTTELLDAEEIPEEAACSCENPNCAAEFQAKEAFDAWDTLNEELPGQDGAPVVKIDGA